MRISDWGSDVCSADLRLGFDKALVATGAEPDVPDIPGLRDVGYFTNETIFGIEAQPRRLLVIGGGTLGCELAQVYRRFGSSVITVQAMPHILPPQELTETPILSAPSTSQASNTEGGQGGSGRAEN